MADAPSIHPGGPSDWGALEAGGQKVEDLRRGDPATQYNLAKVYAKYGQPKEAVRRFELACSRW